MPITSVIFGVNHGIDTLLEQLEEELEQTEKATTEKPKAITDWKEAAKQLDRFRDRVSAYYGFHRELIMPVYAADPGDPLKDCAFDVLGIGYEVRNTHLTCTGEVAPDER